MYISYASLGMKYKFIMLIDVPADLGQPSVEKADTLIFKIKSQTIVYMILRNSYFGTINLYIYNRVSVLGRPLSVLHDFHNFPYIHGGRLHPHMYAGFIDYSNINILLLIL